MNPDELPKEVWKARAMEAESERDEAIEEAHEAKQYAEDLKGLIASQEQAIKNYEEMSTRLSSLEARLVTPGHPFQTVDQLRQNLDFLAMSLGGNTWQNAPLLASLKNFINALTRF